MQFEFKGMKFLLQYIEIVSLAETNTGFFISKNCENYLFLTFLFLSLASFE